MFVEAAIYDPTHHLFLGRHCPVYLETVESYAFSSIFFITEEDDFLR